MQTQTGCKIYRVARGRKATIKQLVIYVVVALSNLTFERIFKNWYCFRCQGHIFSNNYLLSSTIAQNRN